MQLQLAAQQQTGQIQAMGEALQSSTNRQLDDVQAALREALRTQSANSQVGHVWDDSNPPLK